MPKPSEAADRAAAFKNDLEVLCRTDEAQGEGRFLLHVDRPRIVNQLTLALGREALTATRPLFILIGGPSSAGKTEISRRWTESLKNDARPLTMDNYYRDNHLERAKYSDLGEFYRHYDVDTPEAIDLELLAQHLQSLEKGQTVRLPKHDIATGITTPDALPIQPAPLVVVEGLFALHGQFTDHLRDIPRLGVFVDAPPQTIRQRWFNRIEQMAETAGWKVPLKDRPDYFARVSRAALRHIMPTEANADLVLNGESSPKYQQKVLGRLSVLLLKTLLPDAQFDHRDLPASS